MTLFVIFNHMSSFLAHFHQNGASYFVQYKNLTTSLDKPIYYNNSNKNNNGDDKENPRVFFHF